MARLRRLAMTRVPFRVRIWEESSPRVTSPTQCRLSSMDQCPGKRPAGWPGLGLGHRQRGDRVDRSR